nr:hypothetical protein [Tanacetum cinerariifolium]
MVSVPIYQDISSVPSMTTPVIDLMTSQSGSTLPTSTATTLIIKITTSLPPPPHQSTVDLTLVKRIDELEQHMENLLQYNLALEESLDKQGSRLYKMENLNIPHQEMLQQRMFKDKSYEAHEDHKKLYDVLEKSLERDYSDQLLSDLEEARQKKRKRHDLPRTPSGSPPPQPPHPLPLAGASGAPEQMWIDDVCTYDISAKYGISHWWFNRQKFYIDRHASPSHRKEVRSNMRILSVIKIKAYSRYGYDYLIEIVLRGADLQEHTIAKKISRTLVFSVNNNKQNIMRFNEIYKFSDGTLTWILEALAYRVKEFKIKRLNPGMNTRFKTQKDVIRSKEFIATIERRLKTRRIYQNLECFVGGRFHDIDYKLLHRTE